MALNIDFDELEQILTSFASDYSDEDVEQAREQANQLMAEQANDQANQVVAEQAEQIHRQGAVISKKNEEIITHSGYQFWKQDEYKEKVYWQCWKVKVDGLRTVQQGRDQKFIQWQAGKRPKGKRTKYVKADRRILTIVQDYENRSTEEFLKGIANNFEMED